MCGLSGGILPKPFGGQHVCGVRAWAMECRPTSVERVHVHRMHGGQVLRFPRGRSKHQLRGVQSRVLERQGR